MAEIDNLQIKIQADAVKANDAIDRLVSKLDRLTASLTGINNNNLSNFANGVQQLGSAMQIMNTVKTADFTRLAKNLTSISSINTQSINATANSISKLTNSFSKIGTVSNSSLQVVDLAKSISKLGNKSVTAAITNIPKLATSLNGLMLTLSKAPSVSQNVIQMTNALANLAVQGSKVGSASSSIVNGLNRTSTSATRASKSFGGLASAIGKFYATYFMVIRAIKGLWSSIESTADYIEAYNYFNVVLGKIGSDWSHQYEEYGYESAEAYADSFSTRLQEKLSGLSGLQIEIDTEGNGLLSETGLKSLGLNIQEVTQYASQLASVTNSVGQTGEVSLAAASAFTKLGSDLSSLFNLDYSGVMDNLQSGLIGQSRALYKYGIDITNATLQTYAYELELEKSVSEMTQAEKMQLRMLAILDQSKASWGDLANTINSPSNMMRQFTNNLKEAGMVLGQLFIPVLQKVMPIVNGTTIAIRRLLESIASLLGVKIALSSFGQGYSDLGEDVEELSDGLDNVASSAKKAYQGLLGFDKLNVIKSPDTTVSGTDTSGSTIDLTDEILKATEEYEKVWQEAFDNMENEAQVFADKIEQIFAPITEPIKKLFTDISIGDWLSAGNDVSDIASSIFDLFSDGLDEVDWKEIGNNIGLFLKGIEWGEVFRSVGNFAGELVEDAFKVWDGAFDTAPFETALITGLALAKFTGLSNSTFVRNLFTILSTELSAKVAGTSIGLVPTVVIAGVTAKIGFDIGKWLGKLFSPDDATFYDNFEWFGEGGFFDTVFNDLRTTWDAIMEMGTDWTNHPLLALLTNLVTNGLPNLIGLIRLVKRNIETLKPVFESFGEGFEATFEAIGEYFSYWLQEFVGGIEDLVNAFGKLPFVRIDESDMITPSKINVKGFATGGYPDEYSLFMAGEHGHAEMLGTVGGKTAVAGGAEITGIREEIRNTANEEIALLRQQNALLQGILEKEFGISRNDIGKATQSWARDYSRRTGKAAFN